MNTNPQLYKAHLHTHTQAVCCVHSVDRFFSNIISLPVTTFRMKSRNHRFKKGSNPIKMYKRSYYDYSKELIGYLFVLWHRSAVASAVKNEKVNLNVITEHTMAVVPYMKIESKKLDD